MTTPEERLRYVAAALPKGLNKDPLWVVESICEYFYGLGEGAVADAIRYGMTAPSESETYWEIGHGAHDNPMDGSGHPLYAINYPPGHPKA